MLHRLFSAATVSALVFFANAASATPSSSATRPYQLRYASSPAEVQMSTWKLNLASAKVQSAVDQGKIDGAVLLVARHGKVVLHRAYGKRDGNFAGPPWQNPAMPLNGIFDLQSITKMFTAIIAVELAEDGELDLDAPVSDYLPEFATGDKAAVHVRDLIRFTAGEPLDADTSLVGDPDPWATILAQTLSYTPNTTVLYSDIGYRILGRVIEVAGGASLDALVKNRITDPLGMFDTGWRPHATMPWKSSRFAGTGYAERDGSVRYMRGEVADDQDYYIEEHTNSVTGCDGVFSTAWDLALFGQMFLNRGARIQGLPTLGGFCSPNMPWCKIIPLLSPAAAEGMMAVQTTNSSGALLGHSGATSSWLEDLLYANKG